jgi:hypothetical protein
LVTEKVFYRKQIRANIMNVTSTIMEDIVGVSVLSIPTTGLFSIRMTITKPSRSYIRREADEKNSIKRSQNGR